MIQQIKAIIESMGIPFRYGNPSQINYYLKNVDYAAAPDGVAAYCYLLTDSEYINGKERATIAVFFSKLIHFDFNGSEAVSVTDDCKAKAKEFLHQVAIGNSLTYQDARFQYGYNDFAENVAWCAVRAYFEDMVPDCWPWKEKNFEVAIPKIDGNPIIYGNIVITAIVTTSDNVMNVAIYLDGDIITPNNVDANLIELEIPGYEEYQGHIGYLVDFDDVAQGEHTLKAVVGGVESNEITFDV